MQIRGIFEEINRKMYNNYTDTTEYQSCSVILKEEGK